MSDAESGNLPSLLDGSSLFVRPVGPVVVPATPELHRLSPDDMANQACEKLQLKNPTWKGSGSFGNVYCAVSKSNPEEQFALKISILKRENDKDVRLWKEEADTQWSLNHFCVVRVFNSYMGTGFIAIQMELCQTNIKDYVKEFGVDKPHEGESSVKILREEDLQPFAQDILRGVVFIHGKKTMHRDIKPENILMVRNKNGTFSAKLGDFGAAKRSLIGETWVGTPEYVAPEVRTQKNGGYDFRCDVWSAGVTFLELLTGTLSKINKETNVNDLLKREGLSESCRDLLNHMLVWKPEKRWNSRECLQHPFVMPKSLVAKLIEFDSSYCEAQQEQMIKFCIKTVEEKEKEIAELKQRLERAEQKRDEEKNAKDQAIRERDAVRMEKEELKRALEEEKNAKDQAIKERDTERTEKEELIVRLKEEKRKKKLIKVRATELERERDETRSQLEEEKRAVEELKNRERDAKEQAGREKTEKEDLRRELDVEKRKCEQERRNCQSKLSVFSFVVMSGMLSLVLNTNSEDTSIRRSNSFTGSNAPA